MASARQGREVFSHALIVAALAAAAYAAEWAQEAIPDWFHRWSLPVHLALLAVVIGAVFLAVYLLETFLKRAVQQPQPIRIERVGLVDGAWISCIREVDGNSLRLIGGGIMRIESTGKDVFAVEGDHYGGRDAAAAKGHFRGTGYLSGSGFIYEYFGGEGVLSDHGVGLCRFRKSLIGVERVELDGVFIALGLNATRRIEGRKLTSEEEQRLQSPDGLELLRDFLAELPEIRPLEAEERRDTDFVPATAASSGRHPDAPLSGSRAPHGASA